MKLLYDFFPIVLFFICYKWFDIYTATGVAIVVSLLQVLFFRLKYQRFEKMHLISFALITILGGATLVFHNPWFIKWKPTAIYWLSAIVFLGSTFWGKKTIIQRMMDGSVSMPSIKWQVLNTAWSIFFIIMGILNLYVAYNFDTNTWVNFKLFGGIGLTVAFIFLQALYVTRHIVDNKNSQPNEMR